eukprot:sb/3468443/
MDHQYELDFRRDTTGTVILILRWYGKEVHRVVPLGNYQCRKALESCHEKGYSASLSGEAYRLLTEEDDEDDSGPYEFEDEEEWSGMWDVTSQSLMVNFDYLKYIVSNGSDYAVLDTIIDDKEQITLFVEKRRVRAELHTSSLSFGITHNSVVLSLSDCQDPYYNSFKMDHSRNNDTFILSLYYDRFQLRKGEGGRVVYELKFSDGKKGECFPDYKGLEGGFTRTPIYRDTRVKGVCPVNRGPENRGPTVFEISQVLLRSR